MLLIGKNYNKQLANTNQLDTEIDRKPQEINIIYTQMCKHTYFEYPHNGWYGGITIEYNSIIAIRF